MQRGAVRLRRAFRFFFGKVSRARGFVYICRNLQAIALHRFIKHDGVGIAFAVVQCAYQIEARTGRIGIARQIFPRKQNGLVVIGTVLARLVIGAFHLANGKRRFVFVQMLHHRLVNLRISLRFRQRFSGQPKLRQSQQPSLACRFALRKTRQSTIVFLE